MSLSEIVHDTGTGEKTLRICNFTGDRSDLKEIARYFSSQEVELTVDRTESSLPRDVVFLEADGRLLAADPVRDLQAYVEGWERSETPGLRTEPPSVIESMTETRFESYDKRRMIHASRVVEFRGWNVGEGELHAGFQHLSKIDFQRNVYRNLGRAHGRPSRQVPATGRTLSARCSRYYYVGSVRQVPYERPERRLRPPGVADRARNRRRLRPHPRRHDAVVVRAAVPAFHRSRVSAAVQTGARES